MLFIDADRLATPSSIRTYIETTLFRGNVRTAIVSRSNGGNGEEKVRSFPRPRESHRLDANRNTPTELGTFPRSRGKTKPMLASVQRVGSPFAILRATRSIGTGPATHLAERNHDADREDLLSTQTVPVSLYRNYSDFNRVFEPNERTIRVKGLRVSKSKNQDSFEAIDRVWKSSVPIDEFEKERGGLRTELTQQRTQPKNVRLESKGCDVSLNPRSQGFREIDTIRKGSVRPSVRGYLI